MPQTDAARTKSARIEKLRRLRQGGDPRVLDLFAGCGGISLGFDRVGAQIVGAVESEEYPAASHARNFFSEHPEEEREIHAQPRDIRKIDPDDLAADFSWQDKKMAVDVVVGGPPCQAFARVGRAKLREVAEHPDAYLEDSRSNLFLRFLDYIRELEPVAILLENVPDALNYGGHNIAEEVAEALADLGYSAGYTLLNAAFYGVPQMRERLFLVAYADKLEAAVEFPEPTHWIDLPEGYKGSRSVALKTVQSSLFGSSTSSYLPIPQPSRELPSAVTAEEAIGDLPPFTAHLEGQLERGPRRFDEFIPYPEDTEASDFAAEMRNWPGFESQGGVYDHTIRYLPRDYDIFRRMNPGDQYPEALEHAKDLFQEKRAELEEDGGAPEPGTEEYEELKASIVPPYDPDKFPNKWRKMEADEPARTLMAHLGKDSYSHIHYDSDQARTISVREAARLQSFPDGFVFEGTMNPAFRQIGNAVPPLLAAKLAQKLLSTLGAQ